MHIMDFNNQYAATVRRLTKNGGSGLAAAQAELRSLLPQLATDKDRGLAEAMIESLPQDIAPLPPPSPLYLEAVEIERAAFAFSGTDEQRIAAITEARRRIWELADQASPEESPNIRALTRPLEHIEDNLSDPQWNFDEPTRRDG